MSTFRRAASTLGLVGLMGLALAATPASRPQQPPSQPAPQAPQQTPPPAQTPLPAQPPPVFRAGVNVVRVDVIITDKKGEPVTDLTEADFDVFEDGKPQKIDLFRLISSDGTPGPGAEPARPITSRFVQEAEAARDDVRLFVIFLDDYHVRLASSMRVREPLVQFLQTQLGPLDMVALMYPLTPVTDMAFTRDHASLVQAVRRFEGRKYDYRPRNPFEEQYAFYPAQTVETVRNQVTMSALKGVSVRLGSMREGRKAVVLVSEGFSALLPPQMRDPSAAFPGIGNPVSRNPAAGDGVNEDRSRFFAETELQQDLRDVFDTANRQNTAIYTLDPRGLATNEFDINENIGSRLDSESLRSTQDTLRTLATNTDGRAIVNRNDLQAGLRQVVRDTSAYYLIGYNSPVTTPDGKFHKIEVKLKRPGLQLRARRGYWAPTAAEAAKATAPPKPPPPPAVERALAAVEAKPRDTSIATWIGTSRGQDGRTRVTFVWEPLPPIPGEKREEPTQVALTATGEDGESSFRGQVPEQAAPDAAGVPAPAASSTGLRIASQVNFEADPGRLQLRVSVKNAGGQTIDTVQQELRVPDLSAAKVSLSTPAVLRARTAREYQALSRDPDAVPTPLREFRRTDRLLIRFAAYGTGSSTPEAAVRLLNRVGQKMSDIPVQPPTDPAQTSQVDLPLAGLSPGEYVIEVRATGEGTEATELIAIRVIS